MPDTFAVTIIGIIFCAIVAAFAKGISRDKCLMGFDKDRVTLQQTTGKAIWGTLFVESTGLELQYQEAYKDKDGHIETSFILYRSEFPTIQALIRYHDDLDEKSQKKRTKELEKTYHPSLIRRSKRKILNFFKTVRDSLMDVLSMVVDLAKKRAPGGTMLASQDKYVSQMKQGVVGFIGTAFEPLLEKHIGAKVVVELNRNGKICEYPGVLKDYTAEYIEIMDVAYNENEETPKRKADIVVSRQYGFIRHLGE